MYLPLKIFLEFATYNQLFSHIDVSIEIGNSILADQECSALCHVEEFNSQTYTIWYPKGTWQAEQTRRAAVQEQFHTETIPNKQHLSLEDHKQLRKQFYDAAKLNDLKEMERIAKLLI